MGTEEHLAEEYVHQVHHHKDLQNANDHTPRAGVERGFQREEHHIEAVVDLGPGVRTVEDRRIADCAVEVDYYRSFDVVVVGRMEELEHRIEVVLAAVDCAAVRVLLRHKTDREIGMVVGSEGVAVHIEVAMV